MQAFDYLSPNQIAAISGMFTLGAACVTMVLRELKSLIPLVLPRNGVTSDAASLDLLRREFAVTVSTTFANNMAPFLNTQLDIERRALENQVEQTMLLKGMQKTLDAVVIQNGNVLRLIEELEREN